MLNDFLQIKSDSKEKCLNFNFLKALVHVEHFKDTFFNNIFWGEKGEQCLCKESVGKNAVKVRDSLDFYLQSS